MEGRHGSVPPLLLTSFVARSQGLERKERGLPLG